MGPSVVPIPTFTNISADYFRKHIYPQRFPALLRNIDIGECSNKWTADYLTEKIGDSNVKVHVSINPKMNFTEKNFVYKTLLFGELLKRAQKVKQDLFFLSPSEFYYLRSLGADPRGRDVADIKKQFPSIAEDINIPDFFQKEDFFSSVFRIGSPGVQLWTHYDVMDNILIQVKGRKRMVLYSPDEALNMYLTGDKSQVLDIDDPDVERFPKFLSAQRHECVMESGDIIFIPALWFHNTLALEFGIAVNIFWRHLNYELYDKNDPYGNKDLIPASRVRML
uniref:tRNA wybutosine-synthesizing protein 4 n=2 Tax=Timema TaxID=61471 RepID=A0A7R9DVF0_TIMPO|nr:unnamed protein product [Timema douglasi]CAD7421617.1 unnamed protein product [Timema poppensis]